MDFLESGVYGRDLEIIEANFSCQAETRQFENDMSRKSADQDFHQK